MNSFLKRFLFSVTLIGITMLAGPPFLLAQSSARDRATLDHKKILPLDLQKLLILDEFTYTVGQPVTDLTAERLANFPPPGRFKTLPEPVNDSQVATTSGQYDIVPDGTDFRHAFGMPQMDYVVMNITENDLAFKEGRVSAGIHYAVRFNGNSCNVGGTAFDPPDFPWSESNIIFTDPNSAPSECGNPLDPNNPLGVETCDRESPSGGYYCWDEDHHHCHARNFYTAQVIKLDDPSCLNEDKDEADDDGQNIDLSCSKRKACLGLSHRSLATQAHKIGFAFSDSIPFRGDRSLVQFAGNLSGIAPGWCDVYWGFLPGQWVLLDDSDNPGHPIPPGKYIFQHMVNLKNGPLDPCDANADLAPMLPGEANMRNNVVEMVITVPPEDGFHTDIEGTLWDWMLETLGF